MTIRHITHSVSVCNIRRTHGMTLQIASKFCKMTQLGYVDLIHDPSCFLMWASASRTFCRTPLRMFVQFNLDECWCAIDLLALANHLVDIRCPTDDDIVVLLNSFIQPSDCKTMTVRYRFVVDNLSMTTWCCVFSGGCSMARTRENTSGLPDSALIQITTLHSFGEWRHKMPPSK